MLNIFFHLRWLRHFYNYFINTPFRALRRFELAINGLNEVQAQYLVYIENLYILKSQGTLDFYLESKFQQSLILIKLAKLEFEISLLFLNIFSLINESDLKEIRFYFQNLYFLLENVTRESTTFGYKGCPRERFDFVKTVNVRNSRQNELRTIEFPSVLQTEELLRSEASPAVPKELQPSVFSTLNHDFRFLRTKEFYPLISTQALPFVIKWVNTSFAFGKRAKSSIGGSSGRTNSLNSGFDRVSKDCPRRGHGPTGEALKGSCLRTGGRLPKTTRGSSSSNFLRRVRSYFLYMGEALKPEGLKGKVKTLGQKSPVESASKEIDFSLLDPDGESSIRQMSKDRVSKAQAPELCSGQSFERNSGQLTRAKLGLRARRSYFNVLRGVKGQNRARNEVPETLFQLRAAENPAKSLKVVPSLKTRAKLGLRAGRSYFNGKVVLSSKSGLKSGTRRRKEIRYRQESATLTNLSEAHLNEVLNEVQAKGQAKGAKGAKGQRFVTKRSFAGNRAPFGLREKQAFNEGLSEPALRKNPVRSGFFLSDYSQPRLTRLQPVLQRPIEQIGLVPRSIIRTLDRFRKQLFSVINKLVLQEFRISRYQVFVSIRCFLSLVFIPLGVNLITKKFLFIPFIEYFWNIQQKTLFINSYQQCLALQEMQNFEDELYFNFLLKMSNPLFVTSSPSDLYNKVRPSSFSFEPFQESTTFESFGLERFAMAKLPEVLSSGPTGQASLVIQQKILKLAEEYNQESIESLTNLLGDFVTIITLFVLFRFLKPQIIILKSFLTESIYSLSDTTKSFLLILSTDLLVGFHSPRGWEIFLEFFLDRFGLSHNQNFILLFVATFPVLLDTVFKYWIFRYLNKISPSTVATYHAMIE